MSQLARRKAFLGGAWRDRDLSWLDFNRRVLSEALDKRTPLLERLKYLAIFTTNLDEFFMKRVGAMRTRAFASEDAATIEDFNAHVSRLRTALYPMLLEQAACYTSLRSQLAEHGIRLATWEELTDAQRTEAADYFDTHISPALTPLSLDPSDPFPFMSNLSTSWGFVLRDTASGERQNVRVKVPNRIPQWLALRTDVPAGSGACWHCRTSSVEMHGSSFRERKSNTRRCSACPAMPTLHSKTVRITACVKASRSKCASVGSNPSCGSNSASRHGLRFGMSSCNASNCTRATCTSCPGSWTTRRCSRSRRCRCRNSATNHGRRSCRHCWPTTADLFEVIRAGDVLVHHPYESFDASRGALHPRRRRRSCSRPRSR